MPVQLSFCMETSLEQMAQPAVVVDKSFAQGTNHKALQELARNFIVIITSSFYYEAFSDLNNSRKRILAGFPEFRRVNVPELLEFERNEGMCLSSFDTKILRVNPRLISGGRDLNTVEDQCIKNYETRIVNPQIAFWQAVMQTGVVGFSNDEIKSVIGDVLGLTELCKRILNLDFIRWVAEQIEFPFASILDARWITFRSIQAQLLHGVTLRYQYSNLNQPRKEIDLEHDIHDIDYLTLGLHAGTFACNESRSDFRKLGWKFKFLTSDGCLLQSESKNGMSHIIAR